jgi:simple sugar transport system ATP-binding protein
VNQPVGAQAEVVLRLRGITKRFGSLTANDAIDLDLHKGEVVALLGENGAGKSTLMSILFGHYVADEGTVEAFGQPLPPGDPAAALARGIGMVHQHFTLADNLTVLDNVMLGTESLWSWRSRRSAGRARLDRLAGAFGLAVRGDARVGDLSVGERQRVEILKALYRDARILILDEPTAVLTPQESASLRATLGRLVAEGLSIIFISHKLDEVLEIGDRVVVLRAGKVAGEVPVADADRPMLAGMMVGRAVEQPQRRQLSPGAVAVGLQGVTVLGEGGRRRLDAVDLDIRAGEIVGLAGVSGNGQSVLSDVLAGLITPDGGHYRLADEDVSRAGTRGLVARGVGRIPEDRQASGVIGDMTIPETLIAEDFRARPFSRFGVIDWRAARDFAARIVSDFDVRTERPDLNARLLSGGNMQKLLLGRALARRPRFVLANQPTRGLDVGAAAYVHQRLLAAREAGAAILLISEDLDEVLRLSDRVAVMFRGRLREADPALGPVTVERLGLMMAGQGFEHAA